MACRDKYGHLPPIVKDSMSFNRDYCGVPFIIQRQSSPMARRDKYGHLLPLSKTHCLSTETVSLPLLLRDNRVQWHAETNMVIFSLRQRLNVFRPRLLKSPLHYPETSESYSTWRQNMVIRHPCQPETSEPINT